MKKPQQWLLTLLLLGTLSSCNFFWLLDRPTTEAQILSRARGCLDQGNYTCASENYLALAGSQTEIAKTELAFTYLAQENAGLSAISSAAAAMSSGSSSTPGGNFINALAKRFAKNGAGETKRLQIYKAYQQSYDAAVTTPALQSLIRFVAGAALAAELLAETATTSGQILRTDIAADPTTCTACGAGCNAPTTNAWIAGTAYATPPQLDGAATSFLSGTASMHMVNAALYSMKIALSGLGATSISGGVDSAFSGDLSAAIVAMDNDSPCFRDALLQSGVGE